MGSVNSGNWTMEYIYEYSSLEMIREDHNAISIDEVQLELSLDGILGPHPQYVCEDRVPCRVYVGLLPEDDRPQHRHERSLYHSSQRNLDTWQCCIRATQSRWNGCNRECRIYSELNNSAKRRLLH